jgi:hypothetical protein
MTDEASLRREYADSRNEIAFARVLERHFDGVFSAALRRVGELDFRVSYYRRSGSCYSEATGRYGEPAWLGEPGSAVWLAQSDPGMQ